MKYAISAQFGDRSHQFIHLGIKSGGEALHLLEVEAARLYRNWKRGGSRGPKATLHLWELQHSRAAQTLKTE